MKLSWLAAISTTLVLIATPVLSQDESTTSEVDPGLESTPTPSEVDPGVEPSPTSSEVDPGVEPTSTPTPTPEQVNEPVPEEGGEYEQEVDYNVIPHIPEDCSDIRIFSARGSDEPYPGRGGAMLGVMCSLFESTGVSCDYEDIVYPANISYSGIFCESANIGAYAGQAQMTAYVQRCPYSRLVLMGYSQGGSVVGDILGGGGGPIFGCEQAWNPSLPRNTAPGSSIAAVATFGAPRFTANQSYNIGRGSNYNGVLARQGEQLSALNEYEDIIAMWCNAGDPVCAVGSEPVNITAHWSYYDEYSEVASRWILATALGWRDVQLDLDLDGQDESVVLTHSNSSNSSGNGTGSSSEDEDGGLSLKSTPGVLGLVALVAAGFISIF